MRQHNKNNNLRKKKITADNIACFTLTSGKKVWVGKNNYQNDWLTLKKADKRFLWLHVKNIPGSHVILQDIEPTMADIKEAAEIAAYFSKARYSANVVVDYITVKKIKKPKGAKPGFVIYTGQKSISVTPIKEDILCKRDN
ncbi:MAG: NFACT RNA binding domain-containing protein [Lactobacillus iners]